jgi:hypothetical protein
MHHITRPSPIVFTFTNVEPMSRFMGMAFSWIRYLLPAEESSVHQFIEETDCFTLEQFALLYQRVINKRNKSVAMNEKHFIVMYAAIYFTNLVMVSQKELDFVLNQLEEGDGEEEEGDMEATKAEFINFANINLKELKHVYRNNHSLTVAMAKINTFQIPV